MIDKTKSTKLYSFRLDIELMNKLRQQAEEEGLTLTQLVQRYLKNGINSVDTSESNSLVGSRDIRKADLLQTLVKILTEPEIQLRETQSPDLLKALTKEIERLGQKVEQLEQKITTI